MKRMVPIYDVIVIGSGISGVSFAHQSAQNNLQTLILESSSKAGGSFETHIDGDFQLELKAHTCYNSYLNLITLIEDLDLLNSLQPRENLSFKIFKNDKIEKITKAISLIDGITSLPNLLFTDKTNKTVEQYYQKVFGKKNYKNLLSHAFNAVLSQDSSSFPANILFKKRKNRRKDIPRSFTIKGGLSVIVKNIIKHQQIEINYNCQIKKIQKENDLYFITMHDGRTIRSKNLCIATPANVSSQLLSELSSKLSGQLQKIEMAGLESSAVVLEKKHLTIPLLTGLIPISQDFFSMTSSDTFLHRDLRGFTFHFKSNLYSKQQRIDYICDLLKIDQTKIKTIVHTTATLPSLRLGHQSIIQRVKLLLTDNTLLLCGNYFEGLAIEDCVTRSFSEFLRMKK